MDSNLVDRASDNGYQRCVLDIRSELARSEKQNQKGFVSIPRNEKLNKLPEERIRMLYQTPNIHSFGQIGSIALHTPEEVLEPIRHIEALYPGFGSWFHAKVIPGLRNGSRKIFSRTSRIDESLLAIAIAKRTREERKLCTLWVTSEARNLGLGAICAEEAFSWLETRKPLFTVPDLRIEGFKTLLNRWDFEQTQAIDGIYRRNSREYVFNGALRLHS